LVGGVDDAVKSGENASHDGIWLVVCCNAISIRQQYNATQASLLAAGLLERSSRLVQRNGLFPACLDVIAIVM